MRSIKSPRRWEHEKDSRWKISAELSSSLAKLTRNCRDMKIFNLTFFSITFASANFCINQHEKREQQKTCTELWHKEISSANWIILLLYFPRRRINQRKNCEDEKWFLMAITCPDENSFILCFLAPIINLELSADKWPGRSETFVLKHLLSYAIRHGINSGAENSSFRLRTSWTKLDAWEVTVQSFETFQMLLIEESFHRRLALQFTFT